MQKHEVYLPMDFMDFMFILALSFHSLPRALGKLPFFLARAYVCHACVLTSFVCVREGASMYHSTYVGVTGQPRVPVFIFHLVWDRVSLAKCCICQASELTNFQGFSCLHLLSPSRGKFKFPYLDANTRITSLSGRVNS